MRDKKNVTSDLPIEKPHPEFAVEWWFYHGFFEGEKIGKRYFMVTFFRHNQTNNTKGTTPGLALIYSILNPETGKNLTQSLIDETFRKMYVELLKKKSNLEIDPDFYEVLIRELEMHGPMHPILLRKASCDSSGQFPDVKWDQFSLKQKQDCFELEIPLLEDNRSCFIQLKPETDLFEFSSTDHSDDFTEDMMYRCYPKLELTGLVGDERITGKAWMDHQWLNTNSLIIGDDQEKIIGWDWFGINLDNGTDIIIFILKNANTNQVIHSQTVLLINGEGPVSLPGLHTEPLEFWESPRTHIKYPVSWKIENSELGLSLTYKPTIQNQEISVSGLARSVWEGIGKITGTMAGVEVSGMARAEFYGYGYIFDFHKFLNDLADKVDKRIEEFLPKNITENDVQKYVSPPHWKNEPEAYTEMISKPVWDLILRRGKRWRPIFGIWMQETLGKSSADYELGICLSELIHTGSLIIDDIQDQSELRRGQPTLHLKYGTDVAINAGNTLYFLPFVELLHHKHMTDGQKLRIYQIMMDTHLKAHFGQTLDIYWSRNMSIENLTKWFRDDIESKILQMYDYKTAAGPKGIAEVAAVLAESDEKVKTAAVEFARSFAVGFQMIDDILNFSSSERWSKVCGEDISNGKLTYVIVKAIKMLEGKRSERLKKILCDENLRRQQSTLDEAVKLVRESGALEESKKIAKEMSSCAWNRFAEIVPNSEPKIMLNLLQLKMIDLAYDT